MRKRQLNVKFRGEISLRILSENCTYINHVERKLPDSRNSLRLLPIWCVYGGVKRKFRVLCIPEKVGVLLYFSVETLQNIGVRDKKLE